MPPRRYPPRVLYLVGLLAALQPARAVLPANTAFAEPILRSIPIITGSVDAAAPTATGREQVVKEAWEEDDDRGDQEKTKPGMDGRTLYSNDGHANMNHNGHISPHSWQDLDGGVFPQRNEEYPE